MPTLSTICADTAAWATFGSHSWRYEVDRARRHADAQAGRVAPKAAHARGQELCAPVEVPAIPPEPRARAEELVQQIAVAVLHVDEVVPDRPRHDRGAHEVADEIVELAVAQYVYGPHPRVEVWMLVRDERCLRPASRVRQLQTDDASGGVAV